MIVIVVYHLSTTHYREILLSAFPKAATSKLVGFLFTVCLILSVKQEAVGAN